MYGPLVDVWTMRFEGKHQFFKRVIREAHNFRNVPLTLADRHQKMMAYHLDAATFFKPALELDKVKSVLVSSLPDSVQQHFLTNYGPQSAVLAAMSVIIDGIRYANDMLVSVGSCAGLPQFRQIHQILIVHSNVMFICREMIAWYHELRSYEVSKSSSNLIETRLAELNYIVPLSAYRVKGQLLVTLKRYILC